MPWKNAHGHLPRTVEIPDGPAGELFEFCEERLRAAVLRGEKNTWHEEDDRRKFDAFLACAAELGRDGVGKICLLWIEDPPLWPEFNPRGCSPFPNIVAFLATRFPWPELRPALEASLRLQNLLDAQVRDIRAALEAIEAGEP